MNRTYTLWWAFLLAGFSLATVAFVVDEIGQSRFGCPTLYPECRCTQCTFNQESCIECNNITSFSEINFGKLNQSTDPNKFSYVKIGPQLVPAFIDDDSLNLNGLVMTQSLSIFNISGFSITAEPFKGIKVPFQNDDLIIVDFTFTDLSNLKFKNQKFDASSCKLSLLNDPSFKPGIFQHIKSLSLQFRVSYDEPLCTLLFKDNRIIELKIADLIEGFRNITKFIDPVNDIDAADPDIGHMINSSIKTFECEMCELNQLDSSLLNPNLFRDVVNIDFTGDLISIQPGLLKQFKKLKTLSISLNEPTKFIRSGSSWMNDLNEDVIVDLKNKTAVEELQDRHLLLVIGDMHQRYDFPEEDFCYFKHFPHERLVFPKLFGANFHNCSCTAYWLLRDWELYKQPSELETIFALTCIQNHNFTGEMANCNLDQRVYKCKREYIQTKCSQTEKTLDCSNFTNLDELIFSGYDEEVFDYIKLKPLLPLTFNGSFDFKFIRLDDALLRIELNNFDGFDLAAHSFDPINDWLNQSIFILDNSDFMFYYNNENLYDAEACIKLIINEDFQSYFTKGIILKGSMRYNSSERVCPYIFKNPGLFDFEIYKLSDHNRLRFFDFSNRQSDFSPRKFYDFNIKTLAIKESNLFNFDSSLLNTELFHRLEALSISENSQLYHIDSDLFARSFPYLKYIGLQLFNLKEFIHSSTNEWLMGLNMNVNSSSISGSDIMKEKIQLRLMDEQMQYDFGEEDFCYFQHIPHGRLVFPIIDTKENINCSCTVLWLMKDVPSIERVEPEVDKEILFDLVLTDSIRHCYDDGNFTQMLNDCNFDKKLDECKAFTGTKRTTTTTEKPAESTVKSEFESLFEDEKVKTRNLGIAVGALALLVCLVIVGFVFLFRKYRSLKSKFMRNEVLSFTPLN